MRRLRSALLTAGLLLVPSFLFAQAPAPEEKPAVTPAPAASETEKLALPIGTRLALILVNSVNTKTAAPGDPVYFETVYPIAVANRVLIPVGSYVRGQVTQVKRPGKVKGRGELHVRFDELTLPNGYTMPLNASLASAGAGQGEEIDRREGTIKSDSTKGEDVGGVATATTVGAGIGAIAGSGKGTAIGAGIGAAAGLAAVLLTRGKELELPRGTTLDVILDRPLDLDPTLVQFEWTGQGTSLPGPGAQQNNRGLPYPRRPF